MGFANSRRSLLQSLGAAAIGISFTGLGACSKPAGGGGAEANKLNFYTWDTYIGETTLPDFKAASGIDVNMSLFSNNDELFAKMKAGNPGFDVIVPSNEFVTRMSSAGLLEPIDHALIPNLKNISPEFLNPDYDLGRKYSMPYTWLLIGIGYRISKMPKGFVPDSWKYVFDSDMFKKKIAVMSESADLIRLTAKYLGYSPNGLTPDKIKTIEAVLTKQIKAGNIHAFHNDDGQDMLASKEVDIVIEYNGDIAQLQSEDKDVGFVVPKEGSLINSDNLCIPKGAPRPGNAHKFINYLLEAKAGADITKKILYPTPNAAAKALMPDSYKNNLTIFPPADIMAKCEYGRFEGAEMAQMMEEAITRVKASA
jgi:spermidine/putrescine transport system substrate-binding protein